MKIAMPVKTAKADTAISPLFGHAKYFAFVDDEKIEIMKNPFDGGADVARWLADEGVQAVLTHHIGVKPFALLSQHGIACYYVGEGRVSIEEALKAFKKGELLEITDANVDQFARHTHKHAH